MYPDFSAQRRIPKLIVFVLLQLQLVASENCHVADGVFTNHQRAKDSSISECHLRAAFPGSDADRTFHCDPHLDIAYSNSLNKFAAEMIVPGGSPTHATIFAACYHGREGRQVGHTAGGFYIGEFDLYSQVGISGLPGLNFACQSGDQMRLWNYELTAEEQRQCDADPITSQVESTELMANQVTSPVTCCHVPDGSFAGGKECLSSAQIPGSLFDREFRCDSSVRVLYYNEANEFRLLLDIPAPPRITIYAACFDSQGHQTGHSVGGFHCGELPIDQRFVANSLAGLDRACREGSTMKVWTYELTLAQQQKCDKQPYPATMHL